MKLKEWLKKNKKTQAWLAKRLKSDQGHVSRLVTGKMKPEFETMLKIKNATNHAVSFTDWL